ncbi:MAG: cytochrome [Candidatus Pacearchaeota archaeon]
MRKKIVGVMGPGKKATKEDLVNAEKLGKLIAENDWVLLTGGKNIGVMEAVNKGAKSNKGMTVGISSSKNNDGLSKYVDIPIITGMGSARNNINVLSSDVIIACGLGPGTLSEIALGIKAGRKIILLNDNQKSKDFLKEVGGDNILIANTPEEVINLVK